MIVVNETAVKVACICCGSEKYATQAPYLCHNCWKNGEAAKLIQQLTPRVPDKGRAVLRACVNGECGWIGKESACLTYKHAGDERLCPHCNDNTESVSLSALRG